ncbi:MAG: hypothetical protein EPN25_01405 [Nitrospirae bacterium]|nr:MAG: hypothetical protein EPN25_01405 [Nitrospirota bacterium]
MNRSLHLTLVFVFFPFLLSACSHVISREILQGAEQNVSFSQLADNTGPFLNKTVILGGTIAEIRRSRAGAEIEVVQNPLDSLGGIIDRDVSEGRFIVMSKKRIDPFIYKKGRGITVAGNVVGTSKKRFGEVEYSYPLLEAREIYLWRRGMVFQLYPYPMGPAYYPEPYPYTPYWFDPYIYWQLR